MLFMGQEFGASNPFLFFADHEPELAARFKIHSIPFLAFFHRGGRLLLESDRLRTTDGALVGGQGRAVLEWVCSAALSGARGGSSALRV